MQYSNKELLEALGIELKCITTSGKTLCPKCSHERKKKTDPCLSVNVTDGTYKCHNCDWKGMVQNKSEFQKKDYIRPVFNNRTELSVKSVNWFASRCITQQTLIDFKITEGLEYMPQTQKQENTIQFNYFRNNELINTKYRDGAKNFKLVKDAELIFFNLDAIKEATECIICEGEIDALSFHQAGLKNVISVPNGASKNQRLDYLDNCIDYFENKVKIYLATDDDAPGRGLRDELCRRLGIERCFKVDFEGCKDANEYLVSNGESKLKECIINAEEFPINGVFSIDDYWPDIWDYYNNGLPTGDTTGDEEFDKHLRFMPGELTTITGIPAHGKTIMLDQISLKLCLNSDWSFGIFSPESFPPPLYFNRLIKKLTGKYVYKNSLPQDELVSAAKWILNKYHFINPEDEGFTLDVILDKAKQLVLRKGIKGLIIDPWNRIEASRSNDNTDGVKWVKEQLLKIVRFSQQTGVHTFLVAHPTKQLKESDGINFQVPNLYSISGSADFFNMTQNGFTVHRDYITGKTSVHIQKIKWDHMGAIGSIEYNYCSENGRFYLDNEDAYKNWIPKNC